MRQYAISFEGQASRTRQEFKQESDINFILKRANSRGGVLVAPSEIKSSRMYTFMDNTGLTYHEILQMTQEMDELFQQLPSDDRKLVGHSVERLLEVMSKPDQHPDIVGQLTFMFDAKEQPLNTAVAGTDGAPSGSSQEALNVGENG